ncbi:MAG: hypothetical protein ACE5JM_09660 [Armatimonadota bacterium]
MEAALRPDDLAPEEPEAERGPVSWAMPGRDLADLTEFIDLPLFGSVAAPPPSGNGASPEPAPDEPPAVTPTDGETTPAGRDGSDADETPVTDGEQLRLL